MKSALESDVEKILDKTIYQTVKASYNNNSLDISHSEMKIILVNCMSIVIIMVMALRESLLMK